MKLLSDNSFPHFDLINLIHKHFLDVFGDEITLESHQTSLKAMGYFKLVYNYIPDNFTICFEHDRLFFDIIMTKENGAFTNVWRLCDRELNTALTKENALGVIDELKKALARSKPVFFKCLGDKLIKDE